VAAEGRPRPIGGRCTAGAGARHRAWRHRGLGAAGHRLAAGGR
jgi:hypothetical protein